MLTRNQQLAARLNEQLAEQVWLAETAHTYHMWLPQLSSVANVYHAVTELTADSWNIRTR